MRRFPPHGNAHGGWAPEDALSEALGTINNLSGGRDNRGGASIVLWGVSTSKKKIALVASAVAMTLAASLAAATPATAAPPPPPGEGLTPQVERASQQAIPHLIALKKQDVRTQGSLALHDGGVHAGVTAPF